MGATENVVNLNVSSDSPLTYQLIDRHTWTKILCELSDRILLFLIDLHPIPHLLLIHIAYGLGIFNGKNWYFTSFVVTKVEAIQNSIFYFTFDFFLCFQMINFTKYKFLIYMYKCSYDAVILAKRIFFWYSSFDFVNPLQIKSDILSC